MSIEISSTAEVNELEKTIKCDRRIQSWSVPIAVLSASVVIFVAPLVAIPAALTSGVVFHIARHQEIVNQEKLDKITK